MVLLWIIFMMTGMVSLHIQLAIAVPTTTDSVSETSTQNQTEELDEIKNNGGGEEGGVEEEDEIEEVSIEMDDGEDLMVVGDMVMSARQFLTFSTGFEGRKGVTAEIDKWIHKRDGTPSVPYSISGQGTKFNEAIKGGIETWETNTCIRFRPKTDVDKSYVKFKIGKGCWSFIGKMYTQNPQPLSLGKGCQYITTAVHMIGHAVGLMHEYLRQDRDQFIRLNDMNINEKSRKFYMKDKSGRYTNYGVKYDYTSLLQHRTTIHDQNGRLALRTVDPMNQGLLGRSKGLSHRDILAANIMYGCLKFWLRNCGLAEDNCENTGYIGTNCNCICPPGTEGKTCQVVIGDYYSEMMSSCNMHITKNNTTIKTPNYPQQFIEPDTWCVYHIMAPKGSQIQIKFVDFQLDANCRNSYLMIMEYKAENVTDTVACGKEFTAGQVHNTITNEVAMFMDISKFSRTSKGFHAVVSFSTGATMTSNPVGVGILTWLLILIFMH